jgi:NitT/TauT family transport system substrate-binding protein
MSGAPKPGFYIALSLVVVALVAFAIYRFSSSDDENPANRPPVTTRSNDPPGVTSKDPSDTKPTVETPVINLGLAEGLKDQIIAASEIPILGPAGDYRMNGDTIDVEISDWPGYAPLIVANGGLEPNADSYFFRKHGFKLKIVKSEAEVEGWQRINSGKTGVTVTTVDVLATYGNQLKVEVPIQLDFSRGGDGIIALKNLRSINDLKGKVLTVAQYTEADFFIRWLAQEAGLGVKPLKGADDSIDPIRINLLFTKTAEEAAAVFEANVKSGSEFVAGAVTWNPFTVDIPDALPDKVHLMVTNRNLLIIADVLVVNAGFAKQNPKIVKGLVEGILQGVEDLRNNPDSTHAIAAQALDQEPADFKDSLSDVHLSNHAENMLFFAADPSKIGNFRELYFSAVYAYGKDSIKNPAQPEKLINRTYLEELGNEGLFKDQVVTVGPMKSEGEKDPLERNELLTKQIRFQFEATKTTLDLSDPANQQALKDITAMMKLAPGSYLRLRGHLDNSKVEEFRAQGESVLRRNSVRANNESKARADSVKDVLVKQHQLDPEKIDTEGKGWDEPLPGAKPEENRRVEVKLFTLE